MTSTYILIVAIIVLGGVLATLGDRIGTKVGKARLSLFNLRPRNTATVVTIITGSIISTLTLGILLATSGSLRQGLLELQDIQKRLRFAKADVEKLNGQKAQIEKELAKTRGEQAAVQQRLDITNKNFEQARNLLKKVSLQTTNLRGEIKLLLDERQELIQQRDQLNARITELKASVAQRDLELAQKNQTINDRNQDLVIKDQTINQRNQELDQAINERNRELAKKDQTINERNQEVLKQDQVIGERESQLKDLEKKLKEAIAQREMRLQGLEQQLSEKGAQVKEGEKQLAYLQQQVESLEQYYQDYQALRQGNVALVRGRVLAFGVVRIVEPSAAKQAIEQLLREANRTAIELTRANNPNDNEPIVQIQQSQVEQLINQIKDGKDYVVRILSSGNYIEGETKVQVFADAALNQAVYQAGDFLATIPTDSSTMTNEEIRQRLDQLLSAAQFRARRAGILGMIQVGDGRINTIIRFIERLDKYAQPVDVRVIVQENTSTAGPLKMQLVAIQKGQVVFKS
jgi:uncharacterized protein (DUF3084 family)